MSREARGLRERIILLHHEFKENKENNGSDAALFYILSESGKQYTITMDSNTPVTCSCPDHKFRSVRCKHMVFVLCRYLNQRLECLADSPKYSKSELLALLENANGYMVNPTAAATIIKQEEDKPDKVVPLSSCEMCCFCLENFDFATEVVLYCAKVCRNQYHKVCYQRWEKHSEKKVSCPYCRSTSPPAVRSAKLVSFFVPARYFKN